jgi:hypothetical protein
LFRSVQVGRSGSSRALPPFWRPLFVSKNEVGPDD